MDAFLNLRPVRPEDEPFLRTLRAQVDAERLGLQYWAPESAALAHQVVDLQFQAHAAHYQKVKSNWDTKDCVIEFNGHLVGRMIVTQDAEVVHLADIAVDRNFRGLGIGHAMIEATKAECQQSKRVLRLRVDPMNTALQFYLQQGFVIVGNEPASHVLEWVPPSLQGKTLYFGPSGGG